MIHKQYDVVPSVENRGLTVRNAVNEDVLNKLPAVRKEKELADLNAGNAQAVAKYTARIEDANARDLHTVTQNGLPLVGPASGDANSVVAMAFNHAMVLIDQRIAELEAKVAQLAASK